jgi:predicted SnoaL-like aldol condensation-catalyzing enzyme
MNSQNRKEIVNDFFRLVGEGRPKDGLKYFAKDCLQHNPYVTGNVEALMDSMVAAMKETPSQFSDPSFKVASILEDGDQVAAYTWFLASKSNPAKGGLRQVHLFRFNGDKIVEYWDVTQPITPEMGNAEHAF